MPTQAWTSTYDKSWGSFHGQEHLSFPPLFGHQYSHVWIDFRGIQDDYMRGRGIDYFENSRRAVLRAARLRDRQPDGLDGLRRERLGPDRQRRPDRRDAATTSGQPRLFRTYSARGAGIEYIVDDGTLAPTAAAASLPFAPEIVIPAIGEMHDRYGEHIYRQYGFLDAFNPSFDYDDAAEARQA